jgi:hypothetical protein
MAESPGPQTEQALKASRGTRLDNWRHIQAPVKGAKSMTYRITGLRREDFSAFLGLDERELAQRGARRVVADSKPGFPCRVSLEDAEPGESLILFNHVSHDVPTPFRSAYAIYVRETAAEPACYLNEPPPVFAGRTLGLRGFDSQGMLRGALLAPPGEADSKIRELFERPEIDTIHAHNAAAGCFAAKIVRD